MSNSIAEKIILEMIKRPPQDSEGVNTIRRRVLRETTDLKTIPTNADLIRVFREMIKRGAITDKQGIIKLLTKRAVRTLSGVAIITVLTKPFPCPGKCVYCPSEKGMPKSYLSDEPAANRAWRLKFDPFEQVRQRILALEANGHPTDKIELIVKGGTWSAYTIDYQYWFIGRCFEAANSRRNSKFETLNSKLEIRNAKTRNINNRISNFEFRTLTNNHAHCCWLNKNTMKPQNTESLV